MALSTRSIYTAAPWGIITTVTVTVTISLCFRWAHWGQLSPTWPRAHTSEKAEPGSEPQLLNPESGIPDHCPARLEFPRGPRGRETAGPHTASRSVTRGVPCAPVCVHVHASQPQGPLGSTTAPVHSCTPHSSCPRTGSLLGPLSPSHVKEHTHFSAGVTAVSLQRPTGRNGEEPACRGFVLELGEPQAPLCQAETEAEAGDHLGWGPPGHGLGLGASVSPLGSRVPGVSSICCWGQMDFCDTAPLVGANVAELSSVPQAPDLGNGGDGTPFMKHVTGTRWGDSPPAWPVAPSRKTHSRHVSESTCTCGKGQRGGGRIAALGLLQVGLSDWGSM